MFGLEKTTHQKKNQEQLDAELYDLELRVRNPTERQKLKKNLQLQIRSLKETLRKGENQEEYDDLGLLLSAYSGMEKMIGKVQKALERKRR